MAVLQDLYNMTTKEVLALSDREVQYLMDHAQAQLFVAALTSNEVKTALRSRLEPALRQVRALRESDGGDGGGVGAPPSGGGLFRNL
jgi:hypothetical protein